MLLVAFVVMQVNMELPMPDPPVSSSSVFAATLELYITGKNITRACVLKGGCAWGGSLDLLHIKYDAEKQNSNML